MIAGGRDQLTPMLIEALAHPDWQVRNASAARLWGYSSYPQEALTALSRCLEDTNETVRLSAGVTLMRVAAYKSQAISNLLAAAASPTLPSLLRLHAVQQLQQARLNRQEFPDAVGILTAASKDTHTRIRKALAQVLAEIAQRDAKSGSQN
jgi:hypothetical protein